jgi:hypothetical protein
MTAYMKLLAPAALLLAGCASAPSAPPTPAAALPFVTSSGLVIGTLSYQFVEAGEAPAWTVHFERIDGPAPEDYALEVSVDPQSRKGFFTGTLPAGVYAFRAAASADKQFEAGAMKMPFEVQPGEVKDAGHFAVNPLRSNTGL